MNNSLLRKELQHSHKRLSIDSVRALFEAKLDQDTPRLGQSGRDECRLNLWKLLLSYLVFAYF